MTHYYPPLEDNLIWTLQVIIENAQTDPEYLEDPECPYPEELKNLFRKPKPSELDINPDDIDLEEEAHALFLELRSSKDHLSSEDNAERMSYFRVATSLLDKLIGMRERANNVKKVSSFYGTVLGVMEEVLEPEQVTKVRERLRDFC